LTLDAAAVTADTRRPPVLRAKIDVLSLLPAKAMGSAAHTRRVAATCLVLVSSLGSSSSFADAPESVEPSRKHGAPAYPEQAPIADDDERPVPDYDGRGDEPTTAGDVLLWIPRIVLSPLYFVSEFVVRRPLGAVVSWAEEEELPKLLVDFFTFGPDRNIGIVPTALIDFGFNPSVGVYHFWNEFLADNNKFRARAATWGPRWLMLKVADRLEVYDDHELSVRFEFEKRPDWVFYGLGPLSQSDDESRFSETRVDGGFGYQAKLWRSSEVNAFVGVRHVRFEPDEGCCDEPTVAESIAARPTFEPPGLREGYFVLRQGVDLKLDTRKRRNLGEPREGSDFVSPPGSGVRLDVRAEHAGALERTRPFPGDNPVLYEWMKYGATLGGFADLTGEQRVVGLSVIVDFADPLREDRAIPFTEQVSLGGDRPLRGYLQGRLIDRSSAVALFEYRWPVWVWLDGTIHYGVGNVFGEHLDGFELAKLRQSFGIGMRGIGSPDHVFELLVAAGTETFDEGAGFDTLRVVLGATSGF
jgi:hypothetical protein